MISIYAVGVVLLLLAGLYAMARNRLVRLQQQVLNARQQIDVQLARRHDLIPNLVEAVKGALAHEKQTLEALVRARQDAVAAAGEGLGRAAAAETALTASLGRVISIVQAAPELRGMKNVEALQEELTSTENRIAFARQHYNDAAARLNAARSAFPASILAGATPAAEFWEAPAEALSTPKVAL